MTYLLRPLKKTSIFPVSQFVLRGVGFDIKVIR